jgi:hypothetical protein
LRRNLNHLLCTTAPERLVDLLRDELPVYIYEPQEKPGQPVQPLKEPVAGGELLFCPSHAYATEPSEIPLAVLHALLGHESAGAWVQHVMDKLIQETQGLAKTLGAVIVDHGPGIGALQDALLRSLSREEKGDIRRRALVVTSRDGVDLAATDRFEQSHLDPKQRQRVVWAINRVERHEGKDWRQSVKQRLSEGIIPRESEAGPERRKWHDWFEKYAFAVHEDAAFASSYTRSALRETEELKVDVESLRSALFEGGK